MSLTDNPLSEAGVSWALAGTGNKLALKGRTASRDNLKIIDFIFRTSL
jgi:hypothetical protein